MICNLLVSVKHKKWVSWPKKRQRNWSVAASLLPTLSLPLFSLCYPFWCYARLQWLKATYSSYNNIVSLLLCRMFHYWCQRILNNSSFTGNFFFQPQIKLEGFLFLFYSVFAFTNFFSFPSPVLSTGLKICTYRTILSYAMALKSQFWIFATIFSSRFSYDSTACNSRH